MNIITIKQFAYLTHAEDWIEEVEFHADDDVIIEAEIIQMPSGLYRATVIESPEQMEFDFG